jgi:PKD repeat protein
MKGDDTYSNFLKGQFYDIAPSGDGAGNQAFVDEIQPMDYGDVDALPVLTSQPVFTQVADGVVGSRMSSEPTIERVKGKSSWTPLGYRTIWLSFGLEGVNNDTSFNQREDLLARALAFLDDTITINPAKPSYTVLVNTTVNLSETTTASFTDGLPYPGFGSSYSNEILYTRWDFGDGTPPTNGGSSINHVYKKVGTYKVYVEAGDGFGHKAVTGPVIVNVVTPPAAPKTISPHGTITNRTPSFTWTKVSAANQYLLEVYYYSPGKYVVSQVITSPTCTSKTCSFKPAVMLKNGTYKWRVRAGISGVWGKSSAWRAFRVAAH